MTPKEKAQELFDKFANTLPRVFYKLEIKNYYSSKQCALIAVDEIMKEMSKVCVDHLLHDKVIYWEQVKEEIQKL